METVRHFDDTLQELIQDLKDTMEANEIDALAAFQIGLPLPVIVIKQENDFLSNDEPSYHQHEKALLHPTETTAYFPGLSAKTKRYEQIKVMYENSDAKTAVSDSRGRTCSDHTKKSRLSFRC